MKTLKFKLDQSKRNKHLKRSINAAGVIYNHCIALHKRYYRMWGKQRNAVFMGAKNCGFGIWGIPSNSRMACQKETQASYIYRSLVSKF